MISVEQNPLTESEPKIPCLAMRLREAAKSLGIGERLLWDLTDRGEIPHVRCGKAILYPTDGLRDWLKNRTRQSPADREKKSNEILE